MLWKILGLVLGGAIALGMFDQGSGPAARASEVLFTAGADLFTRSLDLAGVDPSSTLRQVLVTAVGVCMPGLVVLALTVATRLADAARRMVSACLVLAAVGLVASYGATALPAAGVLVAAASLLSLATGLILVVPVTALATIIAISHARLLFSSESTQGPVAGAATRLSELAGAGDPSIWGLALLVTAAGPLGFAVQALLRD
jgi:hypothetical protein